MQYSDELKDSLLRWMLPPNNESIAKISREEGISEQTLRNWRDKARADGIAAPATTATHLRSQQRRRGWNETDRNNSVGNHSEGKHKRSQSTWKRTE